MLILYSIDILSFRTHTKGTLTHTDTNTHIEIIFEYFVSITLKAISRTFGNQIL